MTIFFGVLWTLLFIAMIYFGSMRFSEADTHARTRNFTGTLWNGLWGALFFFIAVKDVLPHVKAAFA